MPCFTAVFALLRIENWNWSLKKNLNYNLNDNNDLNIIDIKDNDDFYDCNVGEFIIPFEFDLQSNLPNTIINNNKIKIKYLLLITIELKFNKDKELKKIKLKK